MLPLNMLQQACIYESLNLLLIIYVRDICVCIYANILISMDVYGMCVFLVFTIHGDNNVRLIFKDGFGGKAGILGFGINPLRTSYPLWHIIYMDVYGIYVLSKSKLKHSQLLTSGYIT